MQDSAELRNTFASGAARDDFRQVGHRGSWAACDERRRASYVSLNITGSAATNDNVASSLRFLPQSLAKEVRIKAVRGTIGGQTQCCTGESRECGYEYDEGVTKSIGLQQRVHELSAKVASRDFLFQQMRSRSDEDSTI
ncbi:uncharacterized protein MYCGRDRAFT_95996 [Zymoseptoria tritici IPO323]|uniref:Uncharacterized protein n=1 Tax=Zymoseptoria tritici (strain CBS 115943 / IPO323) TaxID=336722 RepID=F9XKI8_ZYMTI|nr:uncharacterized protein MYCGRDRAFT_95996 [Zymoseptoria tritici IPO323]EGP84231.1 hypothetical protein MYCGRDRAFT_95996 [Zymoseptoria tritici IPO323]